MNVVIQNFFGEMISLGRNARRENLLHYVCQLNAHRLMWTCLEQGWRLCEQDLWGRTPAHVIIEKGHQECIAIFLQFLKNYNNFNEVIQEDLRRVFQVYNNKGHTILHEAVLGDMKDVVREMLIYCRKVNLKMAYSEVLGCGDTLLHLVVGKNLLEMAKIICDFLPELISRGNYAGILPEDLKCITGEMQDLLKSANKN